MSVRKCVNCGHNIREKADDGSIVCRCEIDSHRIGYIECFECWCRRWCKDHSFDWMMEPVREFLFRGKRSSDLEWAESAYPFGTLSGGVVVHDFIPATVGQYIGVNDRKKKKIFEGDIIKYDFGEDQIGVQYAVIQYSGSYHSFMIEPLHDWMYCRIEECEVVGNIYDNPELLEVNHETD